MSGFVGILNLDGAPVDRAVLERMTRVLAFRGPDAQEVVCHGSLGLGHAMLRVTLEAAAEKQPGSLEERLYIAADARIDARAELIAKLKSKSSAAGTLSLATPDSELILHAYDCWGTACVEHLLGDFSFAIWDARERRLFCARDQFGVKPFYYAQLGSCVVFSNTLNCLRMHPAVSGRLNDLAIADFLLFDSNQESSTTSFADIRRLPPGNALVCQQNKVSVHRYWELSITTPIHYARDSEYVENFLHLLDMAVADRLRADSAGVMMSGGLDSPTVAASARRVSAGNGNRSNLHAYTEVFNSLIPHEERHYATLAAETLGIPVEFLFSDDVQIFGHADQPRYQTPEPTHTAWPDKTYDQLDQVASRSRVVLTGYGGDPALCGRITVHFRQLLRERRFGEALWSAIRYLGAERRVSRLYIATRWRLLFGSKKESPHYPAWINEHLEKQLGLRERWDTMANLRTARSASSVRPEAMQVIAPENWVNLFESLDAGSTKLPVEVYHPIFDLRLLTFLLALPRMPWCSDKELFREAGRGVLPERVRLRRKSPLRADPLLALLAQSEASSVNTFEPAPELERYVIRDRIPPVMRESDPWAAWVGLRPLSLNFWLHTRTR